MTNYKKYLWSFAFLPMLAACSADEPLAGSNSGSDSGIRPEDGVYMTVNMSLAGDGAQTRSFTDGDNSSNNGSEVGTDKENNVNSVLIVLASPEGNKFIAYSYVNNSSLSSMTAGSEKIYKASAKFSKTSINSYYSALPSTGDNPKANVYVYCNPGTKIVEEFKNIQQGDATWMEKAYTLTGYADDSLWSDSSGFLMTNVKMAPRLLPANMSDWNLYTTENRPFDLSGLNYAGQPNEVDNQNDGRGAINVRRVAARFDFRDGSQMNVEGGNGAKGVPFTYNVILNEDYKPTVQVELTKMALVNMNKSVYLLGRVSNNGLNAGSTLLGAEKPWYSDANGTTVLGGNYVVGTLAEKINSLATNSFNNYNASDLFYSPFFGEDNEVGGIADNWKTVLLKDVVANASDNYGDKSYHVWRYVTENAIPGDPKNQTNGVTTGVVFKAKMKPTDELKNSSDKWDELLYKALEGKSLGDTEKDPVLYSYAGKLYVTWNHVQTAALKAAGFNENATEQKLDRSVSLYMACFGNGGAGTVTIDGKTWTDSLAEDVNSANHAWTAWNAADNINDNDIDDSNLYDTYRKNVTGAGFTIYQSSQDSSTGWGYYSYYYYWNRHNDNNQNGVMGNMEFAVVRNNVYKLAVTRLSTLGHPRIPQNDPDSPTPNTPDEKSDLYITVSVKVVPWTVRLNNIEF